MLRQITVVQGIVASITIALFSLGGILVVMQHKDAATPKNSITSAGSIKDAPLFVDPDSNAVRQARIWRNSEPEQADNMDKLAALPTAKWLTTHEAIEDLNPYLTTARKQQAMPVLVAYYIPQRDCGRYSAGGANSDTAYRQFIDLLAKKIGSTRTIVILEPDALAGINGTKNNGTPCLTNKTKALYYTLLRYAVAKLKALPATYVYIDAGNSAWDPDADTMASRLQRAGVVHADGFSLNISNFQTTASSIAYGTQISTRVDGKHFVIDTSRNGLGPYENPTHPDYNWCNPPGRALGHVPTTTTGHNAVDAYLYIKYPGESDGTDPDTAKCFGGPAAGTWWPEYALELIYRQPKELRR